MGDAARPPAQTVTLVEALRAVVAPGTRVGWDRAHGERHLCIVCGGDCMRIAAVNVIYTHEVCKCGEPSYDHLVHQLWHRHCFRLEPAPSDGGTP